MLQIFIGLAVILGLFLGGMIFIIGLGSIIIYFKKLFKVKIDMFPDHMEEGVRGVFVLAFIALLILFAYHAGSFIMH